MRDRRAMIGVLLGALAFGVGMAVLKGQDGGLRDAIGNTSAPWVALPFLAGSRFTRIRVAALAGLATTMLAFAGFYVTEAFVLDLGPHPFLEDLRLTAGTVNVYEKVGVASGVVYGALGGVWRARGLLVAPLAVAAAFLLEPALVWLLVRTNRWGGGGLLDHPALWVGEIALGVVTAALVLRAGLRRQAPAPPRP